MKKTFFLFTVLMIWFNYSNAQVVQPEDARILAHNFYSEVISATMDDDAFILAIEPTIISDNGLPVMYVFETTDRPGFIMIAADYAVYPVLGYSFESYFNEPSVSPAFEDMIAGVASQITSARVQKLLPTEETEHAWTNYLTPMFVKSTKEIKAQLPLLLTKWNQDCYYNELCPADLAGPCGHVYAGCVATAMAQVMKFHNWPDSGEGYRTYLSNGYGTLHVDFSEQIYDWSAMYEQLNDQNYQEGAKLIYHCGVAVQMNYSPDGSGAQTLNSADVLRQNFKYSEYTDHMDKEFFSDDNWAEMLRIELLSQRPIMYRGFGTAGGHAFVCDGFQDQGPKFFHFDFGWSGSSNGYYNLTTLNGFAGGQAGLFGVEPRYTGPSYCEDYTLLTASEGTISDGSGNTRYANNSNCEWLIQPDDAGAIALTFTELKTEPGIDRIFIYEGTSENDRLIATVSGFDLPAHPVVVSGGSMFVKFISDEMNAAPGWEATYTTWFTDVEGYTKGEISVSPNPASELINVQLDASFNEILNILVCDLTGRKVLNINTSPQNGCFSVDVSTLAKGVYTIEVFNGNQSIAQEKIVINK